MNGSDIKSLLVSCIEGDDVLVLGGGNPLGSSRINELLVNIFGGTLTATVGEPEVGDSWVVYDGVKLEARGFALAPQSGSLVATLTVYTGTDGTLDCSVQATLPSGWTFVASFPQLGEPTNSPLAQLTMSAASVGVDSGASTSNGLLEATIVAGQSIISGLGWLLGQAVPVSGPVGFVQDSLGNRYPTFTLSSVAIDGPDVSGFGFDVYLNVRCLPAQSPAADGTLLLWTMVDLTTDLVTPAITLPILISILSPDQTQFLLQLDPFRPTPAITDLDELSGFSWGRPTSSALSVDTPIGNLSLKGLCLALDAESPENPCFYELQVSIELGTDWTVVDGILELTSLEAQLFVPVLWGGPVASPPAEATAFSITVTADFVIATADLQASITYPDETVTLQLAPGAVIDIDDFMSSLAKGVSLPGTSDLQITSLNAFADIQARSYSLSCSAKGQLTVIPNMVLDELELALNYGGGAVTDFQFGCQFTIANAGLYLGATWAAGNWTLSGSTEPGQAINLSDLVADILTIFHVALPADLPKIVLSQLDMTYQTQPGSFAFDATIAYVDETDPILKKIGGSVAIDYTGTASDQWTGSVSGFIVVGSNQFTVDCDFARSQTVSISWQAQGDETVGIADLCGLFGITPPAIPSNLDLALVELDGGYDITSTSLVLGAKSATWVSADLVAWQDPTQGWMVFFGLAIGKSISLTSLPLVGTALKGAGEVSLDDIAVDLASGSLTAAQVATVSQAINAIASGYPLPPMTGMSGGVALSMIFNAGGTQTPISIGAAPAAGGPTAPARLSASPYPFAPDDQGTTTGTTDNTQWFNIQKTFGPVSIQKVGVRYDSGKLWALMNASLVAGGLEIDVLGLGMGSPLSTFDPSFTIDGLAVSLQEGPVSVSGGLVGTIDPLDFYGELMLTLPELSISALGGYAEYQGHPSFFLYAVLDYPLGGPSFFFVTGLAAGLGFNRQLVVPDVGGVQPFPLVQWASGLNAPSSSATGDIGQEVQRTLQMLADKGVVAPALGEYWLAAGVRFTSFELLDSFALLIVSFGTDFEVDLLGLSTLSLPPDDSTPVAEAQLALKASFSTRTGLLGISGQLTPNSYVLSRDCHLTGGFAFYLWVSGEHEGEFVVTLGGYSPHFTPPSYYPQVPRLGINWKVNGNLTIAGDEYFALTSSAVMAGGGMSAVWQSSGLRAWFSVQADFLMVFTPFHYYVSASIQLGASVRINLKLTHITISIHLGVGIEIWGPSFSGVVHVDLSVVRFTIGFGSTPRGGVPTTVGWTDFVSQLLPSQPSPPSGAALLDPPGAAPPPGPSPAVLQVTPTRGLVKTLSDQDGALNWLVDAESCQLAVSSAIPLKAYTLDPPGVQLAPPAMQPQSQGQPIAPNTDFGVGPTGTASGDFQSSIEIEVVSQEDSSFVAVMVLGNVPKALWEARSFDSHGVVQGVDPVNDTTLENVLTGFLLVPVVTPPDHTLPIKLGYLQFTIDPNLQQFSWSQPVVQSTDPFTDQTVSGTIAASPATVNRPSLVAAINRAGFRVATALDVGVLADPATNYLLASPILRLLGEAR